MAERREITTGDGVRLSYIVAGAGPPVLLIPGVFMTADWWVADGFVETLAADHRVLAVDPLGSGHSDRPLEVAAYTDERLVDHLGAVIDAEDARPCVLWGWGRGAMIALLYARRRPAEVRLLVSGGDFLGIDRDELADVDIDIHRDNDALVAALARRDWARVWQHLSDAPEWFRERAERDNDPVAVAAVLRASRDRAHGFLPPPVPTLAIWGDEQPLARRNAEIVEALPIESEVVPGDRFEAYRKIDAHLAAVRRSLEAIDTNEPG